MPNNAVQNVELEDDLLDDEDFGPEDFGFIIGPDGNLKGMMFPEKLMEDPPNEVMAILEIFGIDSIHDLENKTLH